VCFDEFFSRGDKNVAFLILTEYRVYKFSTRMFEFMKKRIFTFLAGIIFAVLCFVALNIAMAPVSKS
jgi:hypothetical protein